MIAFLHSLTADGRVQVAAAPPADVDPSTLAAAIDQVDAAARRELADEAPPLSSAAAAWSLTLIEAGCRFLVHRQYDADAVAAALTVRCPGPVDAATIYSADLFLRHLPELARLARGLAADDPLVEQLTRLGRAWPLSSVGMADTAGGGVVPILAHPSLRQLYVDRIIARRDAARLADPAVRDALRTALGDHAADLAPSLVATLTADRV